MHITTLRVHPVSVPRLYATLIASEAAGGERPKAVSHFFLLEVATETGLVGWGELSDVEPEDLPADLPKFADQIAGFAQGRDPFEIQRLHAEFDAAFPNRAQSGLLHAALSGLDIACYDLAAQAAGVGVQQLLGGRVREDVRVSWVAYIRADLSALREEIQEKTAAGFDAFKLKVGVDIDLDEERLAVLRQAAGPGASIKVDANGGWSVDEAPRHIARLARYDLAGVETPVASRAPEELAAIRAQTSVPILEHVNTPQEALALVKHEAVDCFNVCAAGCGGLWPARQVTLLAEAAGVGVLLGSTVELGPGTLAQLHLAGATRALALPSDLIGPGMYTADVLTRPLRYDHGRLHVPSGPGLGAEVDPARLAELRMNVADG